MLMKNQIYKSNKKELKSLVFKQQNPLMKNLLKDKKSLVKQTIQKN